MTQGMVLDILREAMVVSLKLAGPLLLISLVTGLIIAIFQAATQIHEQTLTFVPKVLILGVALLLLGPWMGNVLGEFMKNLFDIMAGL
ncbi:MAG: flagellar biosynthesis protein FliQ [Oscillospiraceae bacterium]